MIKQKTADKSPKPSASSNGHKTVETTLKPVTNLNGHQTAEKRPKPAAKPLDKLKTPVKQDDSRFLKFQGLLQEFNLSPKGGIEGFLLHNADGVTVQVNVTPDVGFAAVRGIGQNVVATVEPEERTPKHGKGNHPVYRLITLTTENGKPLVFANRGDGQVVTVEGVVKRINYTEDGEANGVVLESGDLIHLRPDGMKRAELKVADSVTATGTASLMPLGQRVIEATTVNGVTVTAKKRPPSGNHRTS